MVNWRVKLKYDVKGITFEGRTTLKGWNVEEVTAKIRKIFKQHDVKIRSIEMIT